MEVQAVVALAVAQPAAALTRQHFWTQCAQSSYAALQRYLYLGPSGSYMYLESYPKQAGDNDYSYLFPLREAMAATIDLLRVPGVSANYRQDVLDRFTALGHYWDTSRGAYDSYPPPPYPIRDL